MDMMEAILGVRSRQFLWTVVQSPFQRITRSKVAIANSKWRSRLQSGDRYFKVAIATSKWRSPVQSSESPVQSGDRQFKVANRQLKVAIATS